MTVNVTNLNTLINHLSEPLKDIGFNMGTIYATTTTHPHFEDRAGYNCNTVACLAGHIVALNPSISLEADSVWQDAGDWLGLEPDAADSLFFGYCTPPNKDVELMQVTLEQAIEVLEHLRDTGEVKWDIILPT